MVPFRQCRTDCSFLNPHFDIIANLNFDEVIFDFIHQTYDTARSHDFVPFGELANQCLVFFAALILRPNQ